jgi:hypothetical protein
MLTHVTAISPFLAVDAADGTFAALLLRGVHRVD